jgi:hypothetical protein
MGPKEVLEESVPERDHRGVISTNVALVAVMCVRCTAVMRTWEQSEMVVDGIPEASAARLLGHGDGLFFVILYVDC